MSPADWSTPACTGRSSSSGSSSRTSRGTRRSGPASCFLPVPISVFLSSQLVSKVLVGRVRPKALMLAGIGLTDVSPALSSQLHAGASYRRSWSAWSCSAWVGHLAGLAHTASLAGVAPGDAGAASGLVNLIQQVGAALGLAVLVTVMDAAAGRAQLTAGAGGSAHLVHGLDVTFGVAALFAIAALVMVASGPAARTRRTDDAAPSSRSAQLVELVDGEGFEWSGPDLVAWHVVSQTDKLD